MHTHSLDRDHVGDYCIHALCLTKRLWYANIKPNDFDVLVKIRRVHRTHTRRVVAGDMETIQSNGGAGGQTFLVIPFPKMLEAETHTKHTFSTIDGRE